MKEEEQEEEEERKGDYEANSLITFSLINLCGGIRDSLNANVQ